MANEKVSKIIVRGRDGGEIAGEDWGLVQRLVYMLLAPEFRIGNTAEYSLELLIPGRQPLTSRAMLPRGTFKLLVPAELEGYLESL